MISGRAVTLAPLRAEHSDKLAGLLDDGYVRESLGVEDLDGLRRRFARWESRRSPRRHRGMAQLDRAPEH